MLKLVAKGFYRELINYGVKEAEVVTVAGHLLDNIALRSPPGDPREATYRDILSLAEVRDDWATAQRLQYGDVTLTPLTADRVPAIAAWLEVPKIRDSFFPRFPRSEAALQQHLLSPECNYFAIGFQDAFVGIIGAEQIDFASSRVEMKKLVGDSAMRGKGIGKRATFLFLYHMFVLRKFFKVYLHTLDINIRNLSLNGKFGFWLEGVFFEDALVNHQRLDVVRMALTAPVWLELFKGPPPAAPAGA
jgi:RimJ/RimL family protein N-acetyltransferase